MVFVYTAFLSGIKRMLYSYFVMFKQTWSITKSYLLAYNEEGIKEVIFFALAECLLDEHFL